MVPLLQRSRRSRPAQPTKPEVRYTRSYDGICVSWRVVVDPDVA